MSMLRYIFLHMKRNVWNVVVVLLNYMAVVVLLLSINQSIKSRQMVLDAMANNMMIYGYIADSTGYQAEALNIEEEVANQFVQEEGIFHSFVDDVCVKIATFVTHPGQKSFLSLCAITDTAADLTLHNLEEAAIYEEGFDEKIWSSDANVCVVGTNVTTYEDENGILYVDLMMDESGHFDETEAVASFQVVGQVSEKTLKNTIFIPYRTLHSCCHATAHIQYPVDSISFRVSDNQKLDDFRTVASHTFLDLELAGKVHDAMVLVLQDAEYLELRHEANKALRMMQFIQPVLYLCAIGAGVMLVVMQMRGRKKEMAVIRSLGAGRLRVMVQSILEYALICLPVTLFALLIWRELSPLTVLGVWLAFMAGALCTIVRFSMIPLVKQIRELEE